jgi:hypothetical protein
MARILIAANGQWFDELRAVAYYPESHVERWILQHASAIFPQHLVIPFKLNIATETSAGRKRPDLALIRRDFLAWTVVEVEVEGHGLSHVVEQTSVFAQGKYNAEQIAEYAKQKIKEHYNKRVGLVRLRSLFSSFAPSVLVIADGPSPAWEQTLSEAGVDFCVFEVYKSVGGQHVYRTSGQYPTVPAEQGHCRPHRSLPNVFEVIGHITFNNLRHGSEIEVVYEGYLTQWEFFEESGKRYLRFVGKSNPLSPNNTYALLREKSRKYYFRRS